jgi:hypothetical protein
MNVIGGDRLLPAERVELLRNLTAIRIGPAAKYHKSLFCVLQVSDFTARNFRRESQKGLSVPEPSVFLCC